MDDIRTLLSDEQLARLRNAYDPAVLLGANLTATQQIYPLIAPWCSGLAATFFENDSPLAARDRERCLIALLAHVGPPMSLAVHVYWGLMEGLSLSEAAHTVALTGCYGGLPKAYQGFSVVSRVARLLRQAVAEASMGSDAVLTRLVDEFADGAQDRGATR